MFDSTGVREGGTSELALTLGLQLGEITEDGSEGGSLVGLIGEALADEGGQLLA